MTASSSTSGSNFACASVAQRNLRDLRVKLRGQPVYVIGHNDERKGQEASFETFNIRLALVRFSDGALLGYDPTELLLPTEIHEDGAAYFEIRQCRMCDQLFPLTSEEFHANQERTECHDCVP